MPYCPKIRIPSEHGVYERNLSSDDFHAQGFSGNNATSALFLVIAWTAVLADSPLDCNKPARVLDRFVNDLLRDVKRTIAVFTDLAYQLTLIDRQEADILIPFLAEMKGTPVFREYLSFYKTRDSSALSFLLTFLNFGKRFYVEDEELNTTALRGWIETEQRLDELTLPPFVSNLRIIMREVFSSWEADSFLPVHGSGAVAERGVRGIENKNERFSIDKKIAYLYERGDNIFSFDDYSYSHRPSPSAETLNLDACDIARLKFVPKDWKKTRSICMEPIGFQWAQQGVRLWYEQVFENDILRSHVFLHDQTANQLAAQFGSRTGLVDTIDLSSASDSVSWALIKEIMPPKVLKHLMATRTYKVELPDGSVVSVKKYAPMGSALCFPVQTSLYSAIALMVGIALDLGIDWRKAHSFEDIDIKRAYVDAFAKFLAERHRRNQFQPFYVYGDDIICDSRMTSNIIEALTLLAFKVNKGKSYYGSQYYRESCGAHYFNGDDVTPLAYKVKRVSPRLEIETVASLIDLANRARLKKYVHLRRHIIQILLYYPIAGVKPCGRNPILFTADQEQAMSIFTDDVRNKHLRTRSYAECKPGTSARDLQRDECRSLSVGPLKRRKLSEQFDNYRYQQWWRSRYHGSGKSDIVGEPMTADTLETGVRWRWTATGV